MIVVLTKNGNSFIIDLRHLRTFGEVVHQNQPMNEVRPNSVNYLKNGFTELSKVERIPTIENLNTVLTQISHGMSCFVAIDNFQNVIFDKPQIPIVLRTPTRIPKGINNISQVCFISKFSTNLQTNSDAYTCLRINATKYIPNVKSFQCQLLIGVYPVSYFALKGLPNFWEHPSIFRQFERIPSYLAIPTSVPPINVVVESQDEVLLLLRESKSLLMWVEERKDISNSA